MPKITIEQRFALEKKLAELKKISSTSEDIFYGNREQGILELQNGFSVFNSRVVFIGRFDDEGRPLNGQYRIPGIIWDVEKIDEDNVEIHEIGIESGVSRTFICKKDFSDLRGPEQPPAPKRPVLTADPEALFQETKKQFEELRIVQSSIYEDLDVSQKTLLEPLREAMEKRELLYSDTMLCELTGRISPEQKHAWQELRNGIIDRRIGTEGKNSLYGNYREYAAQTQRLAAANGLENTFTLFGHPDHVFNVAVVEDKLFLIDGWNGDLMCEFTAENFYRHQSLHAVFDLLIVHLRHIV